MGYKCGLVGLPNVGKSSLFNIFTQTKKAKVGNFPFCTIEPNIAKVPFIDCRLKKLAEINGSEKIIYSLLEFVDIAGLVKQASEGQGLGNKFLANIAEVDLIIHVVRCFEGQGVEHVMSRIDPVDDLNIIITELQISDLNKIDRLLHKNKNEKEKKYLLSMKEKLENNEKTYDDYGFYFLSSKPIIVVGNGDEEKFLNSINEYCIKKEIPFVSLQISFLESINFDELEDKDKDFFLEDITKLINYGFQSLNLISYFTAGPKETRSWTINKGTNAVDAASKIHTDISKRFIAVEVTSYEDYIAKKLYSLKGKDYIVNDGDVLLFRHN